MKLVAGLLIMVIALLGVMIFHSYEPEQWSYIVVSPKDANLTEELDKAGSLGYELVFARRASDGNRESPTMSYEMIFKRRGALTATAAPLPAVK